MVADLFRARVEQELEEEVEDWRVTDFQGDLTRKAVSSDANGDRNDEFVHLYATRLEMTEDYYYDLPDRRMCSERFDVSSCSTREMCQLMCREKGCEIFFRHFECCKNSIFAAVFFVATTPATDGSSRAMFQWQRGNSAEFDRHHPTVTGLSPLLVFWMLRRLLAHSARFQYHCGRTKARCDVESHIQCPSGQDEDMETVQDIRQQIHPEMDVLFQTALSDIQRRRVIEVQRPCIMEWRSKRKSGPVRCASASVLSASAVFQASEPAEPRLVRLERNFPIRSGR
ncbi:unnamed protein product [Cladocopium goreaui]|uniref:Uncharacterized protein n=1 Tax=Cladocopium goreaui TaxID=2562237 RepID=A0A9P1G654_9DINO|nr:unnamed protein product [Cladocopium goreaui]